MLPVLQQPGCAPFTQAGIVWITGPAGILITAFSLRGLHQAAL